MDLIALKCSMETARDELSFGKWAQPHRRGEYSAMSTGISYGGGSQVRGVFPFLKTSAHHQVGLLEPGDLKVGNRKNQEILKDLEQHSGIKRLTKFIEGKEPLSLKSSKSTLLSIIKQSILEYQT